jgi:hypothetical protein
VKTVDSRAVDQVRGFPWMQVSESARAKPSAFATIAEYLQYRFRLSGGFFFHVELGSGTIIGTVKV